MADVAGTEADEGAELLLLVPKAARLGLLIVSGALALAAPVIGRQLALWAWMLGLAGALAIGALVPHRRVRRVLGHAAAVAAVLTAASWPTSGATVALSWGPAFSLIAAAMFVMAGAVRRPAPEGTARGSAAVVGDLILLLLLAALLVALTTWTSRDGLLQGGQISCGSLVSPGAPPPTWTEGCGLLHRQQLADALAAIGLIGLIGTRLSLRIRNRHRLEPTPRWLAYEVQAS